VVWVWDGWCCGGWWLTVGNVYLFGKLFLSTEYMNHVVCLDL
jgi:hypothetical protein